MSNGEELALQAFVAEVARFLLRPESGPGQLLSEQETNRLSPVSQGPSKEQTLIYTMRRKYRRSQGT